jgi:hypothetical protein
VAAPSDLSDEQIRTLAAEILSRDEYFRPGIAEEAWRALLARILGFLDFLEALRFSSPLLYWMILGILLLAAVVLLAHVVWTVRLALRMPGPETQERARPAGPGFLEQAESLAREERFLEAARRVELGILELLLRRRVIELSRSDPGRTLREQVRVSALPEAERSSLISLQRRLEAGLFREHAADRVLYQAWLDLHRRLESVAVPS